MSLVIAAILIVLPFVCIGLIVAIGAFLAVQVGYEVVDSRATKAAVKLHTESRASDGEPVRQPAPAAAGQTETARVA
jgi:hypothetical protein